MSGLSRALAEPAVQALLWSLVTVGFYGVAKLVYRRWPRAWLMPLAVAPVLTAVTMLVFHESYRDYLSGTKWLMLLLGPATVAFAIPIYEQRALIRAQWPVLIVGVLAGSLTAMGSSWLLAMMVGLDGTLRLSLMPRSISTPFAMEVSRDIGGIPDLTAVFVVVSGIIGAILGDIMLARVPLGSAIARGVLFGAGAHGAGAARASEMGKTEGAVAGLIMVLVGVLNVFAAPLVAEMLR